MQRRGTRPSKTLEAMALEARQLAAAASGPLTEYIVSNVGAVPGPAEPKKPARQRRHGPKSSTSEFLGVTQYKRTGKWEAHIWVKPRGIPNAKGRQVHLGTFIHANEAAKCYDRACIHFRGWEPASLNFDKDQYREDGFMQAYNDYEDEDFVEELRRHAAELNDRWVKENPNEPMPNRPVVDVAAEAASPSNSGTQAAASRKRRRSKAGKAALSGARAASRSGATEEDDAEADSGNRDDFEIVSKTRSRRSTRHAVAVRASAHIESVLGPHRAHQGPTTVPLLHLGVAWQEPSAWARMHSAPKAMDHIVREDSPMGSMSYTTELAYIDTSAPPLHEVTARCSAPLFDSRAMELPEGVYRTRRSLKAAATKRNQAQYHAHVQTEVVGMEEEKLTAALAQRDAQLAAVQQRLAAAEAQRAVAEIEATHVSSLLEFAQQAYMEERQLRFHLEGQRADLAKQLEQERQKAVHQANVLPLFLVMACKAASQHDGSLE